MTSSVATPQKPTCLVDMSEWRNKASSLFALPEVVSRVEHLRRLMLVHSCIYYELNTNVVSDHKWQEWANELTSLQKIGRASCRERV